MKSKTGITFGAFEIFHYGHFVLLARAKALCERLIVAVSDDEYVRVIKGHDPAVSFETRAKIIESMRMVDLVIPQSLEFGKKEAIKFYNPDVILVGNDWNKSTFSGEGLGVPVLYLPRTKGISSSLLRESLSDQK